MNNYQNYWLRIKGQSRIKKAKIEEELEKRKEKFWESTKTK